MTFSRKKPQKRVSQVKSVMAPTAGINDTDPLAAMPPSFCIDLVNFIPKASSLSLRGGYAEWVTNIGSPVRTLATFNLYDGTIRLVAFSDAGAYDVTDSTDSPSLGLALSTGVVSTTQFANIAGNYLVGCNGVDPAFLYDSSLNWVSFTEVGAPVNPGEIQGVDPSLFSCVHAYKGRLWFVEKESMTAWYLDTDAVGGVATPFYLGSIFSRGGYLASINTWSLDSGSGMDDLLVFRSSAGEIAIYAGNDPDDASTWALKSVYFVSPPVGVNSSVDSAGDLIMLTRAGLIKLSAVVKGVATESLYDKALTRNISATLSRLSSGIFYNPQWQLFSAPGLQFLGIVVPGTETTPATQFIMNLITGAWGRLDLPALCMVYTSKDLYFASADGTVYIYTPDTYLDDVDIAGENGGAVQGYMFGAFNYFDDPTTIKHFKMIRPIFQSTEAVSFIHHLNFDFDVSPLAGSAPTPVDVGILSLWDGALWDSGIWSSSSLVSRQWVGVQGIGFCAALLIRISADSAVNFVACEYVFEDGEAV